MSIGLRSSGQEKLEKELAQLEEGYKRRFVIDRLVNRYIFTNVNRATLLLEEQKHLLQEYPEKDLSLSYHLQCALVRNVLYQFEESEFHFRKALKLVEERGDLNQQTEVIIDFAGTCMNLGNLEEAFQLLDKAKRLLNAYPDKRLQARLICREGYVMLQYGNFSEAIKDLLQAEKAITLLGHDLALKDFYFLTLIYSGLGKLYGLSDEPEKSVRAFVRVISMCESMGIQARLAWHYLNAGSGYLALQDLRKAEEYFRRVLDTPYDPGSGARASALANLGYCSLERKDFSKALSLFQEAEEAYRKRQPVDLGNLSRIERWRGRLYQERNKPTEALRHYTEAFKMALEKNNYRQLAGVSRDISDFYFANNDYENAYDYLLLHTRYAENHNAEINKRLQLELEIKYEAEKRKQESEMLRLQATQLQLKALRAQMNPHFLYNALNAIQNYITSNEVASAAKYLARFAKLMRQSLEYSEAEVISLEKEVAFLRDYLYINQHLRFHDKMDFTISVDEELEEDIIGVPTMIVQPYVENALEHGLRTRESGKINISFMPHGDEALLCRIEDNGIGRKKARELQRADARYRTHQSMGTRITEERLRILSQSRGKDKMFVTTIDLTDPQTGEGAGTRVDVVIPVLDIRVR